MVNVSELVGAYINSKHGWAVREQFESTFQGEDFAEQNMNALIYIRECVEDLLKSEILNEFQHEELQDYRDNLEDHICMMKS